HLNTLCARAVPAGVDVYKVLQVACLNPVVHYKLPVGQLRIGDPADFIVVQDLVDFAVRRTYVQGRFVAEDGVSHIQRVPSSTPNKFHCTPKALDDFRVPATVEDLLVIEPYDGQLITGKLTMRPTVQDGACVQDPDRGLLKIAVVNRYADAPVAISWITGFGLRKGALASCVAHDSHNIVAVGANDEDLCAAVNAVIAAKGGISLADGSLRMTLPLPVAGIMSDGDAYTVARAYSAIDQAAKTLGCTLSAPFMSLSFMALLVIPHLKMSDLGLFDGDSFSFAQGKGQA
ncbi:MAG: adenine deaminase C-terminal domain-containing protein, partial [Flavobacteriales bacterium]